MHPRIPPPTSLIEDNCTVVISNKRPIHVYSNRVLRLFTKENLPTVRLVALGGAISTAQRVAKHCVKSLKDTAGWTVTFETKAGTVTKELPVSSGDGFGEIPNPDTSSAVINSVEITLYKSS